MHTNPEVLKLKAFCGILAEKLGLTLIEAPTSKHGSIIIVMRISKEDFNRLQSDSMLLSNAIDKWEPKLKCKPTVSFKKVQKKARRPGPLHLQRVCLSVPSIIADYFYNKFSRSPKSNRSVPFSLPAEVDKTVVALSPVEYLRGSDNFDEKILAAIAELIFAYWNFDVLENSDNVCPKHQCL
eukprot:CAMPEP_0167768774 /NCGR_PEP_ID=MMETSP0110_2-20121227/16875_1 /TAXON_ID=629695 /ORGANISM="Gymnochlora sp., Strain CCMP2014" /LENGTH=181 /DNA_ID=CAMNT_0007657527 /DNA_START=173 /DNA_END=714 /DNA_ORIENTATION=+